VALPTERTAVFGVSAGESLALALGLRHPHVYGAVLCASPAALQAAWHYAESASAHIPCRWHTGAVLPRERKEVADALRDADADADVVMNERAGSHGGAFWREEFPLMVAWAFGR